MLENILRISSRLRPSVKTEIRDVVDLDAGRKLSEASSACKMFDELVLARNKEARQTANDNYENFIERRLFATCVLLFVSMSLFFC